MGNLAVITKRFLSLAIIIIILLTFSGLIYSAEENFEVPRTEYGFPDLQGYWSNLHQTPIERPEELGNKRAYSEEEALALVQSAMEVAEARNQALDPSRRPPSPGTAVTNQADDDFDEALIDIARINGEFRTSLIIDPANGRIPRRDDPSPTLQDRWRAAGLRPFDGPEFAGSGARCIIAGPKLSLLAQRGLSPYAQIVQTKDYFIILGEYPYVPRIIRLNAEHPINGHAKWMGDSVGYWKDDTLVVHTNKFHPQQGGFPRGSDQLEITERFTATEPNVILYSYTVSDPLTYTKPFTAEIPLRRMPAGQVLYEYACHEGNYSFGGMLTGARRQDVDADLGN